MDVLETRLEKALERLEALEAPARETIDLTKEEDEGGLGGPIFLAPETPDVSLVAEALNDETVEGIEKMIREWTSVDGDVDTERSYEPTGPWGPEF